MDLTILEYVNMDTQLDSVPLADRPQLDTYLYICFTICKKGVKISKLLYHLVIYKFGFAEYLRKEEDKRG